ncbi:MAG TPA: urate hydroxylase PuuD [Casimicrobiaceae bacterium]|nr:urate hydroxylase PuuD [Casimicrobiaceae bacterium]
MEAYASDWLQLILRWIHLITGIAWIGASFYFVWLDNSLAPPRDPADADAGVGGELWAVHGGGFYVVRKFRVAPAMLPATLHWFKWEAYWTWISGFALLVVLYYAHARLYLIDPAVAELAPWQAIGLSVALIVVGWIFYDQLCKRLGFEREPWIAAAMLAFLALTAWGLSHLVSGRGLYIQIGAMLGTIMVANVAHVIIPAQRKLVAAKERGVPPDPVEGLRGKQRSVHNNYFTLPVLFIMISNHYPLTYGHPYGWAILIAIVILAAYVRHFFNLRHKGRVVWAIPVSAALGAAALAIAIAPAKAPSPGAAVSFIEVQDIVARRCVACHAEHPTQPGFASAPNDLKLDTPERIATRAAKIYQQAVVTRAMPIGNLTGMTDDERAKLASWVQSGASR